MLKAYLLHSAIQCYSEVLQNFWEWFHITELCLLHHDALPSWRPRIVGPCSPGLGSLSLGTKANLSLSCSFQAFPEHWKLTLTFTITVGAKFNWLLHQVWHGRQDSCMALRESLRELPLPGLFTQWRRWFREGHDKTKGAYYSTSTNLLTPAVCQDEQATHWYPCWCCSRWKCLLAPSQIHVDA